MSIIAKIDKLSQQFEAVENAINDLEKSGYNWKDYKQEFKDIENTCDELMRSGNPNIQKIGKKVKEVVKELKQDEAKVLKKHKKITKRLNEADSALHKALF